MSPLPQTPSQTVGPFLGIGLIHGKKQNILADERTAGKRIRLAGVVYDGNGNPMDDATDRKSTRLNSSHSQISYAVFCLKKKNLNSLAYNVTTVIRLYSHHSRHYRPPYLSDL